MRALRAAFWGLCVGVSVLLLIASLQAHTPWYFPAGCAAAAITAAVLLRRALDRPRERCLRPHGVGDAHYVYICRRRAGHKRKHREGNITWSRQHDRQPHGGPEATR